jgi:hypothetical protein
MTLTPQQGQTGKPTKSLYAGLFLVTLCILLLELGLTRIFSVVIYYHMAFFAISVTLFGMAFGATLVHFFKDFFRPARANLHIGWMALLFGISVIAALALMLGIRFDLSQNRVVAVQLLAVSAVLAIPFTFGGIAVAIALTRFPGQTSMLYGFDLAGAALGCLLYPPLISWLGGSRFILLIAGILSITGVLLLSGVSPRNRWLTRRIVPLCIVILTWVIFGAAPGLDLFQVRHLRGATFTPGDHDYDKWNSISRITVTKEHEGNATGVSPDHFVDSATLQHTLMIDMMAATPILENKKNDPASFFYPFHDVSYAAHVIRPDADVAVIGVGGGRDILAAKAWNQHSITGIEINSRIIEALEGRYHEYGGGMTDWPNVEIVHDEARSHIAGSRKQFDIIQASLIDTFAATAAGAFVLTENGLYTMEGWKIFLDHLSEDGILTMSRWYTEGYFVESIRLLVLARAALEKRGIKNPQKHIIMVRNTRPPHPEMQALATILVSKSEFTPGQVEKLTSWAAASGLKMLVTPQAIHAGELKQVLESEDLETFVSNYPFEISPPTDNKPFFFDVLRWRDIFKKQFRQGSSYIFSINLKPLVTLGSCLIAVILMAIGFILVPLWLEKRRLKSGNLDPLPGINHLGRILYFMMLGLGYIMIELTLMQRFTSFLGHPAYSLTVCLFTMLLSSGIGSMLSMTIFGSPQKPFSNRGLVIVNGIIFVILLATLPAGLMIIDRFTDASTWMRIVMTSLVFIPAGFLMGMPFPLAIQAASQDVDSPLSWYWGINGAFSVCSSVLVIVLGHSIGLNAAFFTGALCYLAASLAALSFRPLPAS